MSERSVVHTNGKRRRRRRKKGTVESAEKALLGDSESDVIMCAVNF